MINCICFFLKTAEGQGSPAYNLQRNLLKNNLARNSQKQTWVIFFLNTWLCSYHGTKYVPCDQVYVTRDLVLTAWISKYLPTPLCGCSTLGTWWTFPGLWSCLRSTTSRIAWPTWATSSTAGWTSPPRRRSTRSRYTWGDHFLISAQEYLRRSFHFILREHKEFGPFLEKGNGKIKIPRGPKRPFHE